MNLYTEILAHYLSQKDAQILFPGIDLDANTIVEMECFRVVQEIQAVISDDSLEDDECFEKIERIVAKLEHKGIRCGSRHDFG